MSDVDAIVKRLKSAPTPPCTCGMDDNMHETTCAIYEWAKAWGELAALRAELEQTRQCIAELEQAIREAQTQLRATTGNWREDCLYRADDILSQAIAHPAAAS